MYESSTSIQGVQVAELRDALAVEGIDARWECMGGNIGALVVQPLPGSPEGSDLLIGDVEGLLTYSDGAARSWLAFPVVTASIDQETVADPEPRTFGQLVDAVTDGLDALLARR